MTKTNKTEEVRICTVCNVYPIERLMNYPMIHGRIVPRFESPSNWLSRKWCDDECQQVYQYQNRWEKIYEKRAKEIMLISAHKVTDAWLVRA